VILESFAIQVLLQDSRVGVLDPETQPRRQAVPKYDDARPDLVP
jgi:hypothetical protein